MSIEEKKEIGKQLPSIRETLVSLRQDRSYCKQSVNMVVAWATTQSPEVKAQITELASGYKRDKFQAGNDTSLRDMMLASWMIQAAKHEKSQPIVTETEKHQEESVSTARRIARQAKERLKPQSEEEKYLEQAQEKVNEINALESQFKSLTNEQLRGKTQEFKTRFASRVNELAPTLQEEINTLRLQLTNETNGQKLSILRQQLDGKEKKMLGCEKQILDELLPEAFAAVREASRRTIGLVHFDVQLIGGITLHDGKIAEMKTGEGKTLVATLPAYLNTLAGHGVHIVTPNDYLSKTAVQWMGPIYEALGMSVGLIEHGETYIFESNQQAENEKLINLKACSRKESYFADITYGTNHEFGFDYLRDNMVRSPNQRVQREPHFAIVDEVDNILIDEARTPLIISHMAEEASKLYTRFNDLVTQLQSSTNSEKTDEEPDGDFTIDEKTKNTTLTEKGIEKIQSLLGIENLYDEEHSWWIPYLDNVLRANHLFQKDRDYIVKNNEIIIVSESTGREMPGRRFSEGLHQALEAKEKIPIRQETITLAEITFQNYFRMYKKLSGMTGTAKTSAEEFQNVYDMDIVEIPTNKQVIRIDENDLIFAKKEVKLKKILEDVKESFKRGQPVLIGTLSIVASEKLSALLKNEEIPHQVLNAKEIEKEALIIAQAGRFKAVTIATNMAGRGVDILLGGNPEILAREKLKQKGINLGEISTENWQKKLQESILECQKEKESVLKQGGLRVIGTERNEARRIDNQLRGRAGRQGDPGSSIFYLSLEDDLMRRFGGDNIKALMQRFNMGEEQLEHSLLTKSVDIAQQRIEGWNFDMRKNVLEFDDVINVQRKIFYADRRKIIETENIVPIVLNLIDQTIEQTIDDSYVENIKWEGKVFADFDEINFWQQIWEKYQLIIPPHVINQLAAKWEIPLRDAKNSPDIEASIQKRLPQIAEDINLAFSNIVKGHQDLWEETQGWSKENFQSSLKTAMLQIIDNNWIDHLTQIGKFLEGISLRAIGGQNPIIAYKKEAHEMFEELNERNTEESTMAIINILAEALQAILEKRTLEEVANQQQTSQQQTHEITG